MKSMILFLLLALQNMALQHSQQGGLSGGWIFTSASERQTVQIPENQLPKLLFDEDTKTVTGFTGCNTFKSTYATEKDSFAFINLTSTQKACDNLQVEMYIRPFLTQVGSYKIEGDKLYLFDKSSKTKFLLFTKVAALKQ
jgi:heat shock protein HslJ